MGRLEFPESGKFYLDTSPIIYSVEQVKPYDALMQPVWESADDVHLVSSNLVLLETLVKPIKLNDEKLEERYRNLLSSSKVMDLYPINLAILEKAIQFRASYGLKTPDAIHAATAIEEFCSLLITNDSVFKRIPGINVVVLDDHV